MGKQAGAGAKKMRGSCHCSRVRFEVELDVSAGATRCNCSVCTKIAMTGAIVKPEAFALIAGEENLGLYEWGGRTGQRYFCRTCGVHCFLRGHLAQLGGDYVSVYLNCLDDVDVNDVEVVYWDGRHDNWGSGPRSAPWPILVS